MHQRCRHCCMKKGHFVVHISPQRTVDVLRACRGLSGVCWDLSGLVGRLLGLVGTCRDLSGVCRELLGLVGVCRDLSGLVRNVDFMESHFEGIGQIPYSRDFAECPRMLPERPLMSVDFHPKTFEITERLPAGAIDPPLKSHVILSSTRAAAS